MITPLDLEYNKKKVIPRFVIFYYFGKQIYKKYEISVLLQLTPSVNELRNW